MKSDVSHLSVQDRWRKKLSEANILDRLIKHYHGELPIPLDQGQIMVGKMLLDKVLPSLKSVEMRADINHRAMSRLELEHRLQALGRNPDDVWKSLNNNKIIEVDASPSPTLESEQDVQVIDNVSVNDE